MPQQTASPPPWPRLAAETRDAFSVLASASPKPSLGSVTPQRQNGPAQKPANRDGDAFSDLVSIGAQSNSSKLPRTAQQSRPASSLPQSQSATQPSSSGADRLSMLGFSSTSSTMSVSQNESVIDCDAMLNGSDGLLPSNASLRKHPATRACPIHKALSYAGGDLSDSRFIG
ncbi:hypothetical protein AURDEDRAFT_159104 [Auricularia subglabra TFB-10046 SS5]|nr:hypothetical protein AURDEDRAFT_159104 [Auricularia subglabra TFB-10046 SS5]